LTIAAYADLLPEHLQIAMEERQELRTIFKSPQRITITIPYEAHRRIFLRAAEEGRSASNLCSFIIQHYLEVKS
jgi:hypothetical protein